ncbi:MAG: hypothetical protein UDG94_02095 [Peptococcaceae bacterium]|nr:hypothetical protein [Peptococcaceae bacterium]
MKRNTPQDDPPPRRAILRTRIAACWNMHRAMRAHYRSIHREHWQQQTRLGKMAYIMAGFFAAWFLFEGLVLSIFNITILGIDGIYALYYAAMICAALARKWKLLLAVFIGFYVLYGIVIFGSEAIWYYLLKWFGIDVSWR